MTMNNKGLNIALWAAQIVLAAAYGLFGSMKAFSPIEKIADMMKWAPDFPPMFVHGLGTLEMLGAIGLILPSLTRIVPRLTVLAALCFTILQICAISLHVSRGEFSPLGLNAVLIGLSLFILWGRSKKVVIVPKAA